MVRLGYYLPVKIFVDIIVAKLNQNIEVTTLSPRYRDVDQTGRLRGKNLLKLFLNIKISM